MRYIILLFLIFISCKSGLQKIGDEQSNYLPYYLEVYKADSLFLTEHYNETYRIYDSLFKKYEPINIPLYFEYENYLKSALLTKKKINYKRYVKDLAKVYGYDYDEIKKDSVLNVMLENITKERFGKWHLQFVSKVDTTYRNLITEMNFYDQLIRKQNPINWENVKDVDLKNDSKLKKLIETKGFPYFKNIGTFRKLNKNEKKQNLGVDVLLNHFTSYEESFQFYNERLPKLVKIGICNPKDYAYLLDRYYNKHKDSTYFYFISFDQSYKTNVELKKKINQSRKEFGLPSIEYEELWLKERLMKM